MINNYTREAILPPLVESLVGRQVIQDKKIQALVRMVEQLCYIITCRTHWLRDLGGAMSPFNAFLFIQGLETLSLRMDRHWANAQRVGEYLDAHDQVDSVSYAGLESSP